jgi:hypothetical protein
VKRQEWRQKIIKKNQNTKSNKFFFFGLKIQKSSKRRNIIPKNTSRKIIVQDEKKIENTSTNIIADDETKMKNTLPKSIVQKKKN